MSNNIHLCGEKANLLSYLPKLGGKHFKTRLLRSFLIFLAICFTIRRFAVQYVTNCDTPNPMSYIDPLTWNILDPNLRTMLSATLPKKRAIKPISIVFPQYHQFPENDHFWGEDFSEWTFLKPLQREINHNILRKPHHDIGYYNLLDENHRRYMRQLADFAGVYGFCFYHYWFKDHPMMDKGLQYMIGNTNYEYRNFNYSGEVTSTGQDSLKPGKIDYQTIVNRQKLLSKTNKKFIPKMGEPNKPFFLCWANEAWSRRWDGSNNDIIVAQAYDSVEGNIDHFYYLLEFFKHPNYIRMANNRPIFAFYRIENHDARAIDEIMLLWNDLAKANGFANGIYFVRFMGPFDNSVYSPNIEGFIEFEPGFSWYPKGGGPSIFPEGKYDEDLYAFNNLDLQNPVTVPNITHHYLHSSADEKRYRSSQFKIYDIEKTWEKIENHDFQPIIAMQMKSALEYHNRTYAHSSSSLTTKDLAASPSLPRPLNIYRGTLFNWNNAPRRNFTNKQYYNYPHMFDNWNSDEFQQHLEVMQRQLQQSAANKASNNNNNPVSYYPKTTLPMPRIMDEFFFLTAWNEWNEQSVFEPNDIDGYDALMSVKSVMKTPSNREIIHIGHYGGGTEKYIRDLMRLFSEYTHTYEDINKIQSLLPSHQTVLIHIHSTMVGPSAPRWEIITLIEKMRKTIGNGITNKNVPIYVTIHDYQWLFPNNPNPSFAFLSTIAPNISDVKNARRLFHQVDAVIYPSKFVQQYYLKVLYDIDATSTETAVPNNKRTTSANSNNEWGKVYLNELKDSQLTKTLTIPVENRKAMIENILAKTQSQFCHRFPPSDLTGAEYMAVVKTDSAMLHSSTKHVLVPHSDVLISHNYLAIPSISSSRGKTGHSNTNNDPELKTINIAFIGAFIKMKGNQLYLDLSKNLPTITIDETNYIVKYHIFGEIYLDPNCHYDDCKDSFVNFMDYPNVEFHGSYSNKDLVSLLTDNYIHGIVYLSIFPETWQYTFSFGSNTGLPLAYLNHGSLPDRIPGRLHNDVVKHPEEITQSSHSIEPCIRDLNSRDENDYEINKYSKYFPFAGRQDMFDVMNKVLHFIVENQNNTRGFKRQSQQIQPNKWYILNYPQPQQSSFSSAASTSSL